MKNLDLVRSLVNKVTGGKHLKEAKERVIFFYVQREPALNKFHQDEINAHDFEREVRCKQSILKKEKRLYSMVEKLERHKYAPELNQVHFKSGKTRKVNGKTTINTAVEHLAKKMDDKEITSLTHPDYLRHFRA